MIKTSILTFITLGLFALLVAFIRQDDVLSDKPATKLQLWTANIPQKKHLLLIPIILHTKHSNH